MSITSTRLARAFVLVLSSLLCAWLMPKALYLLLPSNEGLPFTAYSGITRSFVSFEPNASGTDMRYYDRAGRSFTEEQFDSILPGLYYAQLQERDALPDSLHGQPISARMLELERFVLRHSPQELTKPRPALYPLMEAAPRRGGLRLPEEVFRHDTRGIEFIDLNSNEVQEQRSRQFTQALSQAGLQFPLRLVAGNISEEKVYDLGFLLLDARGALYQLRQVRGLPEVTAIAKPQGLAIANILVTEFPGRRTLAFVQDSSERLFALRPDHRWQQLPIGAIDLKRDYLVLMGNPFDWSVQVLRSDSSYYYGLDAQSLELLDSFVVALPEGDLERVRPWLFGYELELSSPEKPYLWPRIACYGYRYLLLSSLLALVYWIVQRRSHGRNRSLSVLAILLLGVYALIPLLLFPKRRSA